MTPAVWPCRRYIGGWPKSLAVLPPGRELSVVDVTCELPRTHNTGGGYLCLPTWGANILWSSRGHILAGCCTLPLT
jgi:hypothetical protein